MPVFKGVVEVYPPKSVKKPGVVSCSSKSNDRNAESDGDADHWPDNLTYP